VPAAPAFDVDVAHRHFAVECFNRAWDLMDKAERTPAEDEQMIRLCLASHWHWAQRADCTQENVSVAHWQTSRIYAMLGQAENARRYAQLCLEASRGDNLPPFCLGYAYEALARAESTAGNQTQMREYLREAQRVTETITDLDTKHLLLADLETIK